LIGRTRVGNLFVNTGHGPLGRTLAAGSARLLAAMIAGEATPVDAAPFAVPATLMTVSRLFRELRFSTDSRPSMQISTESSARQRAGGMLHRLTARPVRRS
jgi:hypothetical protein